MTCIAVVFPDQRLLPMLHARGLYRNGMYIFYFLDTLSFFILNTTGIYCIYDYMIYFMETERLRLLYPKGTAGQCSTLKDYRIFLRIWKRASGLLIRVREVAFSFQFSQPKEIRNLKFTSKTTQLPLGRSC